MSLSQLFLLGLAGGAGLPSGAPELRVSRLAYPDPHEARDARLVDLDRDGALDLVVVGRDPGGRKLRSLRIHRRQNGAEAFVLQPDLVLPLTDDVVAWALADLDVAPGAEVLLFSARALFSAVLDEGEPRYEKLADIELVWQIPPGFAPVCWQWGVRDLDGDGLEDLLVPETGGWRLFRQRREEGHGRLEESARLRAPTWLSEGETTIDFEASGSGGVARSRRSGGRLELGLRFDDDDGPERFLAQAHDLPVVWPADWEGDGDLDLCLLDRTHWRVWLQDDGGRFENEATLALVSPVPRDRARQLDISFAAHAADLDGDRKTDALFLARDLAAKDVRTQVLVYDQSGEALFGAEGLPRELLVVSGYTNASQIADFDGDGLEDLALVSFRPDAVDALRSAAGGSLDLELLVFLRGPRGFGRAPSLRATLAMPLEDDPILPRFLADLDGDGLCELLTNDAVGKARIRRLARVRGGLELASKPLLELAIPRDAELEAPPGAARELLIYAKHELVHVGLAR